MRLFWGKIGERTLEHFSVVPEVKCLYPQAVFQRLVGNV